MASGTDLKRLGWNGDGSGSNGEVEKMLQQTPGIVPIKMASCTLPNGIAGPVRIT
jgi:hypothetical protein